MKEIDKNPFKLINTKIVYKNPWITVREDSVIRPGGKEGIFGVIEMVPGVSVLPLDNEEYVYLANEYKYGISDYSLEVFSGAINERETLLDGAKRELEEELGMKADEWIDLGSVNPFTTIVNSPNHMFLARNFKEGVRKLDSGEEIQPALVLEVARNFVRIVSTKSDRREAVKPAVSTRNNDV